MFGTEKGVDESTVGPGFQGLLRETVMCGVVLQRNQIIMREKANLENEPERIASQEP